MSGITHPWKQGVCNGCGRILTAVAERPAFETIRCPGGLCEGVATIADFTPPPVQSKKLHTHSLEVTMHRDLDSAPAHTSRVRIVAPSGQIVDVFLVGNDAVVVDSGVAG